MIAVASLLSFESSFAIHSTSSIHTLRQSHRIRGDHSHSVTCLTSGCGVGRVERYFVHKFRQSKGREDLP